MHKRKEGRQPLCLVDDWIYHISYLQDTKLQKKTFASRNVNFDELRFLELPSFVLVQNLNCFCVVEILISLAKGNRNLPKKEKCNSKFCIRTKFGSFKKNSNHQMLHFCDETSSITCKCKCCGLFVDVELDSQTRNARNFRSGWRDKTTINNHL